MTATELAWAAGFFDGEGSVPLGVGRSGRPTSPYITITQAGPETEPPDSLLRFQTAVGVRCLIYGPTFQEGRKPRWMLQLRRYEHVVAVRDALWPYLCSTKKVAFEMAFEAHREVRENRRPRSVPHVACKYGHEFTPDNEYWSSGRRSCRTCGKERARQQRLPAKETLPSSTSAD